MRVLRARLYEAERERQAAEQAAARSAQVGTGARAEKIRTYNYPAEPRHRPPRRSVNVPPRRGARAATLDDFTEALTADEQRRALEAVTLGEVLRAARPSTSSERASTSPRLDAELLLAQALGLSRIELYTQHDRPLTEAERDGGARARRAARRARAARVRARRLGLPAADAAHRRARARAAARDGDRRRALPRARSRGVDGAARASTSARAAARSRSRSRDEHPGARVVATDLSADALALARENAARARARRSTFVRDDLLDGVDGPVRPRRLEPAVRRSRASSTALEPEVRDWEPRARARRRGPDRGAGRATRRACSTGWLVLEVHEDQRARGRRAARGRGLRRASRITRDLAGTRAGGGGTVASRPSVIDGARARASRCCCRPTRVYGLCASADARSATRAASTR